MDRVGTLALRRTTEPVAADSGIASPVVAERLGFDALYEQYLDFVWRSALRLGIERANVDDVLQEVFFVVHKKLPEFEGRSSLKTWLFGILVQVTRHHRRTRQRRDRPATPTDSTVLEAVPDQTRPDPEGSLQAGDALRRLDTLLRELDDDKREVFVLSQVEQLTALEISEILAENLNTVYSRLRAARRDFEQALVRQRAREARRQP